MLTLESRSQRLPGYATTFAIGHLVLQVIGYSGTEDEISIEKRNEPKAATQPIWPYTGSVVWPPRLVLDERGLYWLADSILHRRER